MNDYPSFSVCGCAWCEFLRANTEPPQPFGTIAFTTYTTNTTAPPDVQTYTDGFEDGWNARGAADGS